MPNDAGYRSIVQRVVPIGPHGPYAMACSEELEGSITFSLDPKVWQEDEWPEEGSIVVLSRIVEKRAGWRARCGRFSGPADKRSNSKEEKRA